MPRLAVPLAVYLGLTLGLPLAHGAAARPGFAAHAAWVLLGCACVVALITAARITVAVTRRANPHAALRHALSRRRRSA